MILAIILCAALAVCYHVQIVSADALVLTNGTIVDGTGADPLTYGTTVIQNGRILKIGRSSDFLISPGATVIDVDGATIMPGIINAHVHNSHYLGVRRRALTNGITSLCDVGSLPPGEGGLNPWGGFTFMWHSHTERELTNNDIYPGGMLTIMVILPPWIAI